LSGGTLEGGRRPIGYQQRRIVGHLYGEEPKKDQTGGVTIRKLFQRLCDLKKERNKSAQEVSVEKPIETGELQVAVRKHGAGI